MANRRHLADRSRKDLSLPPKATWTETVTSRIVQRSHLAGTFSGGFATRRISSRSPVVTGLPRYGSTTPADRSLIEDGTADYVDVAKHKPRTLAKRRCLRYLRRRRRCQTGGRRRARPNFRQLRGRSPSRFGKDRDDEQLTAVPAPLSILKDGLYDLGGGCSKSKQKKNSQYSNRGAKTGDVDQKPGMTSSRR